MTYPASYDSFEDGKNKYDVLVERKSLIASAVSFIVTVDYNILQNVSFSGTYSTEVSNTPLAGQFRVYYRSNQIELGPLGSNTTLNITYTTSGKAINAEQINQLNTAVAAIETTLGLNPQGTETDLADRLAVISSVAGMLMEIEDFTSVLNSSTNIFALQYPPIAATHTFVILNGLDLRYNVDYIVDGQNIVLSESPYSTDTLEVKYFRAV